MENNNQNEISEETITRYKQISNQIDDIIKKFYDRKKRKLGLTLT